MAEVNLDYEVKVDVEQIYQMIKEEYGFELKQISELVEEKDKKIEQLEKALDKAISMLGYEFGFCTYPARDVVCDKEECSNCWKEYLLKDEC